MAAPVLHDASSDRALAPDVNDWRRFVRALFVILVAACAFFLRSTLDEVQKLREGQASIREVLARQGEQLNAIARQLDQAPSTRRVR